MCAPFCVFATQFAWAQRSEPFLFKWVYAMGAVILSILLMGQVPTKPVDPVPVVQDVELLLQGLDHADQSIRLRAARDLRMLGPKAAVPLARAMSDGVPLHAVKAAVVLLDLGRLDADAAAILTQAATQTSCEPWRWSMIIDVLLRSAPGELRMLTTGLQNAMASDDPLLQSAAVRAAIALQRDAAGLIPQLDALLARERSPFRRILLEPRVFTDNAVALTLDIGVYDDLQILQALAAAGVSQHRLWAPLARLADNTHPFIRLRAARQIRELDNIGGAGPALDSLIGLLENDQPALVIAAIRELAEWGPTAASAAPAVARHLTSGQVDIRRAAAVALEKMGPAADAVVPVLEQALAVEKLAPAGASSEMQQALQKLRGQGDSQTP